MKRKIGSDNGNALLISLVQARFSLDQRVAKQIVEYILEHLRLRGRIKKSGRFGSVSTDDGRLNVVVSGKFGDLIRELSSDDKPAQALIRIQPRAQSSLAPKAQKKGAVLGQKALQQKRETPGLGFESNIPPPGSETGGGGPKR